MYTHTRARTDTHTLHPLRTSDSLSSPDRREGLNFSIPACLLLFLEKCVWPGEPKEEEEG